MDSSLKKLVKPLIITLGKKIESERFTEKPIIIGACPRSGTTLLLSILDAHPNIYSIQNQTYAFTSWKKENLPGRFLPVRLDRLYREFLFHRIKGDPVRWCEKTPKNIQFLDKIIEYFSDTVKIIHLVRDGRDVVTSRHPKHTPNEYWVSVERWVKDVEFALQFHSYPNVYSLHYEDLINNFEAETRKLLQFLEEEYVPEIANWFENTTVKKSKNWKNPVQELHSGAIAKWKKPEHRCRYEEFMNNEDAVKLSKKLGYEI